MITKRLGRVLLSVLIAEGSFLTLSNFLLSCVGVPSDFKEQTCHGKAAKKGKAMRETGKKSSKDSLKCSKTPFLPYFADSYLLQTDLNSYFACHMCVIWQNLLGFKHYNDGHWQSKYAFAGETRAKVGK